MKIEALLQIKVFTIPIGDSGAAVQELYPWAAVLEGKVASVGGGGCGTVEGVDLTDY